MGRKIATPAQRHAYNDNHMYRRAQFVFLAILFLVLTIVVGFAALGMSSTETVVQRARDAYTQEHYDEAIRHLNLAYESLGPNSPAKLRQEIIELRYKSHLAVENWRRALEDIDLLRAARPEDKPLVELQVYHMILHGEATEALEVAKSQLAKNPSHGRILELAGEACQKIYGERITEIRDEFARNLGPKAQEAAIDALKSWWYRKPGDPQAQLGRKRFRAILKEEQPDAYSSNAYESKLDSIRGLITQSQDFYRRALESDGQPVAAYRGLIFALEQGSRFDDVMATAEIYLEQAKHKYSVQAAIDLATIHLNAGRYAAVVEAVQRYLPAKSWQQRAERGQIDNSIRRLFVIEAKALLKLKDTKSLQALKAEVQAIQTSGILNLEPEFHHIRCLAALGKEHYREAERYIKSYLGALGYRGNRDLRIEALHRQLEILDAQKSDAKNYDSAYRALIQLDAKNPSVYVKRAHYYLEVGKVSEAVVDARNAFDLDKHNEDALKVYSLAIDQQMTNSGRGSKDLLGQCIDLQVNTPPELADEALLLPLAELALSQGHPEIAQACARDAGQAYNWARWPRYVLARAALTQNLEYEAIHAAEAVLRYYPADPTALSLLRTARKRLNEPTSDLLFDLVLAGEQDADIALALFNSAVARASLSLSVQLALTMQRNFPKNAKVQRRVAEIMMAQGKIAESIVLLDKAAALAQKEKNDELYVDAYTSAFVLRCFGKNQKNLAKRLLAVAELLKGKTDEIYRIAKDLKDIGRLEFANELFSPVLSASEYQADRSGPHYLLGAQLALSVGQRRIAEQHLLAAMSFEDGRMASRTLTLLLTQEGRVDAAREAYWDKQIDNLVSACLASRYGDIKMTQAWTKKTLGENPLNVPARILEYLLSPAKNSAPLVRELVAKAPATVREALTYLEAVGFEAEALTQTQALIAELPENPYAVFLHARALENSGKPQEAINLLLQRIKATPPESAPPIVCFDEAIRLLNRHGIDIASSGLAPQLLSSFTQHRHLATPRMVASATRSVVMGMGFRPETLVNLAKIWIEFPLGSNAGFAEVELLTTQHPDLALQLLLALQPHLPESEFSHIETQYYSLISIIEAAAPNKELVAKARKRALKTIATQGPFGAATHFLIDRDILKNGHLSKARRKPERDRMIRKLLQDHLNFYRAGKDTDTAMISLTFKRIYELEGRKQALVQVEKMLRHDPSLIPLWVKRSQWLVLDGQHAEALAGLRWLYHYVPSDMASMTCAEIAARAGKSTAEDEMVLAKYFPKARLQTPAAKLTLGLLALRGARYGEADKLLATAQKRSDGSQLYFRALANLALGNGSTAKDLFIELEANYPKSSLSSNAGHFARQLSRSDKAASSPTKR